METTRCFQESLALKGAAYSFHLEPPMYLY